METINSSFIVTALNLLIYFLWMTMCAIITNMLRGEQRFTSPYQTIITFILALVGLYLFFQLGFIPYFQLPITNK